MVRQGLSWFISGIRKNALAAMVDATITACAYLGALALRTGLRFDTVDPRSAVMLCGVAGGLQVLANILTDVYWREWRFVSLRDAFALLKASLAVGVLLVVFDLAAEGIQRSLPLSTIPVAALLSAGLLLTYRLRGRFPAILRAAASGATAKNVLIVGAGDMGQALARDLEDTSSPYRVRAFVDPDSRKVGNYIRGHRVEGALAAIPDVVNHLDIQIVAVAVPEVSGRLMQQIIGACDGVDVQIRKVGRPRDALSGAALGLERLEPEDLLRRSTVRVDEQRCRALVQRKTVLITGAAGSIGSELARHVLRYGPGHLVLVDIDESRLFDLSMELNDPERVTIRLVDLRDRAAVQRLFRTTSIDIVFHAAALKHAPLLETHVVEAIETNIFGTLNVSEVALACNVDRFVFIGTDKAVEPMGVMGATKRVGELLIRSIALDSKTILSVVRFGNVLGSRGSVVPLFLSQIEAGGPVTITDERATRYFMTIGEAAALVIEAATIAMNGDVFMLEMGDPIPIVELARRLIRARGLRVGRDVEIKITGLRPGEKLTERLRFDYERTVATAHPLIVRLDDGLAVWRPEQLVDILADLHSILQSGDDRRAREGLFGIAGLRSVKDQDAQIATPAG